MVAFAGAADDVFAVLEIFVVLLDFFEDVVPAFVAIGDAFKVEVVLTEEVVALLTMSTPTTLSAWPAMIG